jgi:hypothetical protein
LATQQVFGRTAGALALVFESGMVVGAASQPSKDSIEIWLERDPSGATRPEPLEEDSELHPISAQDSRYADARWAAACGARVSAIRVLRRFGQNLTHSDLPSEAAVQLDLDNGDSIFLGHGLHDDSDDFAVLHAEEIEPAIRPALRELLRIDTPLS